MSMWRLGEMPSESTWRTKERGFLSRMRLAIVLGPPRAQVTVARESSGAVACRLWGFWLLSTAPWQAAPERGARACPSWIGGRGRPTRNDYPRRHFPPGLEGGEHSSHISCARHRGARPTVPEMRMKRGEAWRPFLTCTAALQLLLLASRQREH